LISGLASDPVEWTGAAWQTVPTTGAPSPRVLYGMAFDEAAEFHGIVRIRLLKADHLLVAADRKVTLLVEDVSHATAHASREVTTR
jgi:hypothetical protein